MQINVKTNFPGVARMLGVAQSQVPFATAVAMNRTVEQAEAAERKEMRVVFHRPTPWFLRSLRVVRATKQRLTAKLWFKDKNLFDSSYSMAEPHILGGQRNDKPMELRLRRVKILPAGWQVVPGEGAQLDAYGNMNRGQITQMLNVLGTYTESGYNKANAATAARLAKGNAKKNVYGFVYWVNPVGAGRKRHLPPGIYQRVKTAFGSSLKPILIFVRTTRYKKRFDFFGIGQRVIDTRYPLEFDVAYDAALKTARFSDQPSLI